MPDGRANFYREAVGEMWSSKLDLAEAARLREGRDRALTEVARRMDSLDLDSLKPGAEPPWMFKKRRPGSSSKSRKPWAVHWCCP